MASNKMRVKVEEIRPKRKITERFSKAEVIGVIEGEYPENYLFEFPNDKAALTDDIIEDTYVTIHYNMRSNRVAAKVAGDDDKFFISLQAWKVEA